MVEIQVQARIEPSGKVIPLEFYWQEQAYFIQAIGRRWKNSQGVHILVQATSGQIFELLFQATREAWYLVRPPGSRPVA